MKTFKLGTCFCLVKALVNVKSLIEEVPTVMQTYPLDQVSDELQRTLDQEARKSSADRKDEVATLLNSERFVSAYDACIWWDGCYYCKDENGTWYCIKCTFF